MHYDMVCGYSLRGGVWVFIMVVCGNSLEVVCGYSLWWCVGIHYEGVCGYSLGGGVWVFIRGGVWVFIMTSGVTV